MPPPASIRLFSSDLDGTLLGNPEATRRFRLSWEALAPESRPLLVYNSGRLVPDIRAISGAEGLPSADFLIGGVGTQIHDVRSGSGLSEFEAELRHGWDLARVRDVIRRFPGTREQPPEFQHAYKSSWFLERAGRALLDEIRAALAGEGLDAALVYSSLRDLDILPRGATKGNALRWLCSRLGVPTEAVVVAGDTGNDSTMFLVPGVRGIVVENAQPELFEAVVELPVFCSRRILADGVIDGLRHFGVLSGHPPPGFDRPTGGPRSAEMRFVLPPSPTPGPSGGDAYLRLAYDRALDALRRNVTSLGFSACSLADNTVTGTDANYRSVWARDGAITVINTLDLDDPEIRACQHRTLDTLLRATSPEGQIPANVRIDDGRPEYAGVGNICSIDSGLWVIIALYNYILATGDRSLLAGHRASLQRTMDWLTAHDSNRDGLLEIPEAGDWTDLFGRSYHVLYDEVLWFRANVCYGRLLEFLGDFDRAAACLRHSQHIRGRVLDTFWPRTAPDYHSVEPVNRFAERQFGLGDTQYLIAEITPFSFNWRCDVLGNTLAFLMNLLDVERARLAFRFMWGAGVNEPWPVANLYPVVQSGDPDWRNYYTVNLLNLPHHYHNGGIWPFVGGLWVRMIHRLGMHEVARRELEKLARLNQRGREHEWEFNEWAHGRTGLPMGKAFQAWSAATFIRACHELGTAPAGRVGD